MCYAGARMFRIVRLIAVIAVASTAACGGNCPSARSVSANPACAPKSIPVGRWNGEWESALMSKPDFKRSGSIDLTVSENGTLLGQTIEHYNGYAGQLTGSVRPGGEFSAEYLVSRDGSSHRYTLKGNFTCDSDGLSGQGVVSWGGSNDRGNLRFEVQQAD
jgi:hypothetical protein